MLAQHTSLFDPNHTITFQKLPETHIFSKRVSDPNKKVDGLGFSEFMNSPNSVARLKSAKLGLAANEKSFLIFRLIFACAAHQQKK